MEIFSSVQGEGKHAGQATTFVRFGGCNLCCSWCDEPNSIPIKRKASEARTVSQILDEMNTVSKNKHVCLTGGEPLIQPIAELVELCNILKHNKHYVSVETNGTRAPVELFNLIDMWTISPKLSSADNNVQITPILNNIRKIGMSTGNGSDMQLKFVIGTREDTFDLRRYVSEFTNVPFCVQSEWIEEGDKFEPRYTMEELKKMLTEADIPFRDREFKIGVQLHKFWAVH